MYSGKKNLPTQLLSAPVRTLKVPGVAEMLSYEKGLIRLSRYWQFACQLLFSKMKLESLNRNFQASV